MGPLESGAFGLPHVGKDGNPSKEDLMAVPVRRRESTRRQPVQRWQPYRDFEDLHFGMDRLLEQAVTGALADPAIFAPPVDIEETDDAWIIEADLPGGEADNINVELDDNELAITGEIKERERTGILRRRTRKTGEFEFRVTLPGKPDADNVEADFNDGVLTVRVPKSAQARPRRIEIGSGHHNGSSSDSSDDK
jgi:HSP20 family protein